MLKKKLINKDLFIDRTTELSTLAQGLKNGSDYVIIAPRRYGKTTLVNKVFSNIAKDNNYLILTIDIMRYSGSIRNLALNITDKCLSLLGLAGKLHSMLNNPHSA
jgi:AAA+ ATPase superfamily predicted ATPase